jgi:hypothetical protein
MACPGKARRATDNAGRRVKDSPGFLHRGRPRTQVAVSVERAPVYGKTDLVYWHLNQFWLEIDGRGWWVLFKWGHGFELGVEGPMRAGFCSAKEPRGE